MQILTALTLTVLLSIIWVDSVMGEPTLELEVTVHSYLNPTGRCDECREDNNPDPGCCDESTIRPRDETCPIQCDPAMTICFRPVDSTVELTGVSCPNTTINITGTRLFFDMNSFDFSVYSFFGITNPLMLLLSSDMGFQILYVVVECSLSQPGMNCGIMQRIDAIPVDIDITVGTASPETTYIGIAGIAQLNVSFSARCADGFYGRDCLTSCPDFESCAGCGLSVFTGEFCQFSTEDCSEVYCNGNGDCVDGSSACDCNPGFTGDLCQNIDDCEGVSCNDSGECIDQIDGFKCNCNPGFTGDLCQVNIDDCEGVSCNNSGECIDQIDGFVCECDLGFTGTFCQHNIDDCEDMNCNDGGCVDEVNGFTCQCNPGFFGNACENTDYCFGITCSGNGQCENLHDTFTCTCETGYTGNQCQIETTLEGSVNVGAIAGGVTGALIGVILVFIIVMVIIFALSAARKRESSDAEDNYDVIPERLPNSGTVVHMGMVST